MHFIYTLTDLPDCILFANEAVTAPAGPERVPLTGDSAVLSAVIAPINERARRQKVIRGFK